jgi:hypothetical protein
MTDFPLLPILALVTFLAVIGLAVWSKLVTRKRLKDDNAQKSSLAKDGPGPQPFR